MSYGAFLLRNPLFWALVAGGAVGVAAAAATWNPARSRHPGRTASRKWAWAWFSLAVAVATAAAGLIVPPDLAIARPASLAAFGAGLAIAGLGCRFPRVAGLPSLVLISAAAVLGAWIVRDYVPVRAETELARVSVLTLRDEETSLEVTLTHPDATGIPHIVTEPRENPSFHVDVLDVPQGLFWLGASRFARYVGAGGLPEVAVRPASAFLRSAGLVAPARIEPNVPAFNLLRTYRLVIRPRGVPELVRE
ncbi:MAG: hypothetical protein ACOC0E_07860 [Spirochaetota bacterium]